MSLAPIEVELDIDGGEDVNIDVDAPIQPVLNADYEALKNKPSINGVTLIGDRTFEELGEETITNAELLALINQQYDIVFGGG